MTGWMRIAMGIAVVIFASQPCQQSAAQSAGTREILGRLVPVPGSVSPQMQAVIGRPPNPNNVIAPQTTDEWKKRVNDEATVVLTALPKLREALGVAIEPATVGGVKAFILTPKSTAPANRNRILINLHGGGRVLYPGESGTREATLMAGFNGYKVISVDYRMPPDFPFPAALDDAVGAYREVLKTTQT